MTSRPASGTSSALLSARARWLVLGILALGLAGCAAGGNEQLNVPRLDGGVAGFWRGVWHGCIAPVTFLISLFRPSVQVFEVHNNGGWYNFGFLLGAGILTGGGAHGASRRKGST